MGNLVNTLSRLIDNGQRQALSLLDEAQRTFSDFDFDATMNSLMETGRTAFDGFGDFIKTVKDTVSDFKVIVPFDDNTETFDIEIEDGVITVKVNGKNTKRKTTATIPSNCIVKDAKHFVDRKRGNLVVVIPKNISEDENLKKFKDNVTDKVNSAASWLKDALKEHADEVAASTTAPTTKPKNRRNSSKVKPKIVRDAKGRFTTKKV
jgi:hypothetical protein